MSATTKNKYKATFILALRESEDDSLKVMADLNSMILCHVKLCLSRPPQAILSENKVVLPRKLHRQKRHRDRLH